MSIELGRRLLASELVTRENIRDALLLAELRSISFPRALVDRGIVTEAELDDEIARLAGSGLRYVQGSIELVVKLPPTMLRRLSALPTRTDPQSGIVDVAAADPFDPHIESEMSFHLKAPVRVLRASIGAVEEAIRRIEVVMDRAPEESSPRTRRLTPALPYGAPGSIPPPAPSTPIPLVVKRSPNSISVFDDADTHVDDLDPNEIPEFGQTAGWGTVISHRAPPPSVVSPRPLEDLSRTAGWGTAAQLRPAALQAPEEVDESASLGRTAAWGSAGVRPAALEAPEEVDESASLGRTAAWGSPGGVRPAAPQAPDEVDESASLGRTAAWGSSYGHRVATVAPAHPLQRTLDFEEDPPRISFPSTPPPGHSSIPPPLGFAAPEVSAWKGLTGLSGQYKAIENLETMEIPGSEEVDVETTFVSDPEDLPQPSPLAAPVETISLNSIPEAEETPSETNSDAAIEVTEAVSADAEADEANADAAEGEFDDVPQRPTLMDFPPPPVTADVKPLIASMADLSNRDAIVELAFRCMSMFARRVALFSAKRNGFNGWLCNDAFGLPDELRKIVIPNDQPSIMATASTTGIYLGPIPKTAVHATLLQVMGQASGDVAVASVRVGGKVAAMLVCDELRDTLSGTRRLDELARAMGDALTRLVKTRA